MSTVEHGDRRRRHRRQCREPRAGGTRREGRDGHVVIDEWLPDERADGLYAIGDVVGPPWLAHKAMHEGRDLRREDRRRQSTLHPLDVVAIPGCTYCLPQVASVGLTEAGGQGQGLRGQGRPLPVHRQRQGDRAGRGRGPGQDRVRRQDRRAARRAHGRRRSHRADPGLRRRAHARGHRGRADATPIFPHPTLSEMMHESVLDAYGRAVHI